MNITVDPKEKKVYLAMKNGWVGVYGHVIEVGDYSFSVIPNGSDAIRVSELTSGALLINYALENKASDIIGADKEVLLSFYEIVIGSAIKSMLEKAPLLFAENVARVAEKNTAMHGPIPEIENVDWMFKDQSGELH